LDPFLQRIAGVNSCENISIEPKI